MKEPKKLNLATTWKTVLWGFFGVRGARTDIEKLSPIHIILIALVCAAILIGVLLTAANFAIAN